MSLWAALVGGFEQITAKSDCRVAAPVPEWVAHKPPFDRRCPLLDQRW